LDKYVLCPHMYLKLQDAWLICGIYVSGGPFENNMMVLFSWIQIAGETYELGKWKSCLKTEGI
jgi:hypothetical protein